LLFREKEVYRVPGRRRAVPSAKYVLHRSSQGGGPTRPFMLRPMATVLRHLPCPPALSAATKPRLTLWNGAPGRAPRGRLPGATMTTKKLRLQRREIKRAKNKASFRTGNRKAPAIRNPEARVEPAGAQEAAARGPGSCPACRNRNPRFARRGDEAPSPGGGLGRGWLATPKPERRSPVPNPPSSHLLQPASRISTNNPPPVASQPPPPRGGPQGPKPGRCLGEILGSPSPGGRAGWGWGRFRGRRLGCQ